MSDVPHLLIPFAASPSPGCQQTLKELPLPHLNRLLARMTLAGTDVGEETDFAPPHERALARALGLPTAKNGITPWAAWQQRHLRGEAIRSKAWAYITPCQWHVSTDHVTMLDPADLQLTPFSSRALMDLLAPWFADDGIELIYDEPMRWIASGDVFEGVSAASLDRVIQRDVRSWMPLADNAEHTRAIHRLQSEMQMLLYTHPLNDARAEEGLPPVNTFWMHGAGRLATVPSASAAPLVPSGLRDAALREDWKQWAAQWRELDAGAVAEIEHHVAAGGKARLTLCGECSSMQFETAERGFGQKLKSLFSRPQRFLDLQNKL
ncbi:phosphoglycerate mutase [Diaphorobacter sp. HDW4A]|uniref:phosphoglycerate mutase n=1 Tax=Diaphorobacter sp. HDW4A TaxID=2714924 RepID=UPI0014080410|nr:phosphoglycerate mutase [Diaphorobacter sp. HDW4A]QIL78628.1 phosphoglycerate mutase [Diaphorobacter sp. HDW4A]